MLLKIIVLLLYKGHIQYVGAGGNVESCDCGKINPSFISVSSTENATSGGPNLTFKPVEAAAIVCAPNNLWCASVNGNEKSAFEAIQTLHRQLDDDKNGNVDVSESDEFLRQELQYNKGYEKRHANFHRDNDDSQVSVEELWTMWINSQVYNWTVEQTANWLEMYVELPQYQEKFRQLQINGSYLPLLAVNSQNFLLLKLGIKDKIDRQKLFLKSQDVVLFGPPKDMIRSTTDKILSFLLLGSVCIICWVYYRNIQMSKDLEALMKSEALLRSLQNELEHTKEGQESQNITVSVLNDAATVVALSLRDDDEVVQLRNEVALLRRRLHIAEVELQLNHWVPPPEFTHWLQETYKLELKEHKRKQCDAEELVQKASKACDKLRKMQTRFLNAFIPRSTRTVDDVDTALLSAKTAMEQLNQECRQREQRWNQMEMLLYHPHQSDVKPISFGAKEAWAQERVSVIITGQQDVLMETEHSPCENSNHNQEPNHNVRNRMGSEHRYPSWQKVKRYCCQLSKEKANSKNFPVT